MKKTTMLLSCLLALASAYAAQTQFRLQDTFKGQGHHDSFGAVPTDMAAAEASMDINAYSAAADDEEFSQVDFKYFTMMLPADCELQPSMMNADLRAVAYSTPNNDFLYYVCFFEMGEDFDVLERLRSECDEDIFDTSGTPLMLTVGGEEDPLLFYMTMTESSAHFTGVFADYINNVGIFIYCLDLRSVEATDKLSLWSKFRRPEQRKVDIVSWLFASIDLRQQFVYGSFPFDHSSLKAYKIGAYELNMPEGTELCETDDNWMVYRSADGAVEVIMCIEPLNEKASPLLMLAYTANEINVPVANCGFGACMRSDDEIVYYTGFFEDGKQTVAAYLPNKQAGEQVRLYVIGELSSQDSGKAWAIARSLYYPQ